MEIEVVNSITYLAQGVGGQWVLVLLLKDINFISYQQLAPKVHNSLLRNSLLLNILLLTPKHPLKSLSTLNFLH